MARLGCFRRLITEDIQNLNNVAIGIKTKYEEKYFDTWAPDREFVHAITSLWQAGNYIYHHTFSAACSSVHFK